MARMDIEDGLRNIPIHPSDYHLLGFKWEGQLFYYDKCLQDVHSFDALCSRIGIPIK